VEARRPARLVGPGALTAAGCPPAGRGTRGASATLPSDAAPASIRTVLGVFLTRPARAQAPPRASPAPPQPRQDKPDEEGARRQLHLLAFVDGREGPGALRVKCLVDDASQAGNPAGVERWGGGGGVGCVCSAQSRGAAPHARGHLSNKQRRERGGRAHHASQQARPRVFCPSRTPQRAPRPAHNRPMPLLPPRRSVRAMRAGLETPNSCWWAQRLFNAATISREWVALQHAHLMPFADSLLRGTPSARRAAPAEMDIPPAMAGELQQQCNESQVGGGGARRAPARGRRRLGAAVALATGPQHARARLGGDASGARPPPPPPSGSHPLTSAPAHTPTSP
jgi:hypothetical protein